MTRFFAFIACALLFYMDSMRASRSILATAGGAFCTVSLPSSACICLALPKMSPTPLESMKSTPPKYRRKVFYKEKRREVGEILRTLCEWKKIKIVEAEVCPDHVHMLVEIPPKVSVA